MTDHVSSEPKCFVTRRRLLVLAAGSATVAACGPMIVTANPDGDPGDASNDTFTPDDAANDAANTGSDTGPSCASTPGTAVGLVTDFAVGTLSARRAGTSIIVGHDADGLYAFSAICTHQGCVVRIYGTSLRCPCHGATFDSNGGSPTSPAYRPLAHFALTVCDGSVYVDPSAPVPATTRVAV